MSSRAVYVATASPDGKPEDGIFRDYVTGNDIEFRMSLNDAEPLDLAVSGALAAVGREILTEARQVLEDPALPEARAIHDFRKAMKRWRALLRLIEPFVGAEARELRRRAADGARGLASARDRQAALDALTDIAKHDQTMSPRSYATMRSRLSASNGNGAALTDEIRANLLEILSAGDDAMRRWPLQRIGSKGLSRELAKTYRRARRQEPEDWAQTDAERLHEWRKLVVAHRYQMELTEPLWPKLGKLWVGETQKLRDRLGNCQDLTILASLIVPHAPLAPWRSRLTPLIAERLEAHKSAARSIAGRLFAEKPKAFCARISALWANQPKDEEE